MYVIKGLKTAHHFLTWKKKQIYLVHSCSAARSPLEGGLLTCFSISHTFLSRLGVLGELHSRKGRPPHTGHLGPWDRPSAAAAGWSPGIRGRSYLVTVNQHLQKLMMCHSRIFTADYLRATAQKRSR